MFFETELIDGISNDPLDLNYVNHIESLMSKLAYIKENVLEDSKAFKQISKNSIFVDWFFQSLNYKNWKTKHVPELENFWWEA